MMLSTQVYWKTVAEWLKEIHMAVSSNLWVESEVLDRVSSDEKNDWRVRFLSADRRSASILRRWILDYSAAAAAAAPGRWR